MQTSSQYNTMGAAFRAVTKDHGILSLYRGIQSPLAGLMAMNSVLFAAYGSSKRLLGETPTKELDVAGYFNAGFLAGTAIAFVEGPVDFFKCQLQMRGGEYRGFFHCASSIVKERGIRGAYQGLGPTLARNGVANAFWYGVYEWARQAQTKPGQKKSDLNLLQVMGAGGAGGVAYWTSIFPVDTIKSAMQSDHTDPSKRKYKNMADCARQLYAQYGIKGFFRGFTPCILRAVPANAATFGAYELAQKLLNKQ